MEHLEHLSAVRDYLLLCNYFPSFENFSTLLVAD